MPFVEGLAWDVENCEPNDFLGLVDALWRVYGGSIMAGHFSIDDYVWHPLTSEEIGIIRALLGGRPPDNRAEQ